MTSIIIDDPGPTTVGSRSLPGDVLVIDEPVPPYLTERPLVSVLVFDGDPSVSVVEEEVDVLVLDDEATTEVVDPLGGPSDFLVLTSDGPRGAPGAIGPEGPQGEDGPMGPQGIPGTGGAGGDLNYVHVQTIASSLWVVEHGLGKFPSVAVVDSGGSEVIPNVHYDSPDQVTLVFGYVTSGKVYVN